MQAPIMSGYFCASMTRIESLPYCYPWDFIMFEFFIACSIIIPLLHVGIADQRPVEHSAAHT